MSTAKIVLVADDPVDLALANGAVDASHGRGSIVLYRGPIDSAPDTDITLVFARDLAAFLAALPTASRDRLVERTLVINAERADVLDLMETHGIAGAIECEDSSFWNLAGRLFIRKEAIEAAGGDVIGGAGRESAHYVLWTHPKYDTLIELILGCAYKCRLFSERDDELIVTREAARQHGLPPVGLRMTIGRVGMRLELFPSSDCYVRFLAGYGAATGLRILNDPADEELAVTARRAIADRPGPVLVGEPEQMMLAGGLRDSISFITGEVDDLARLMWCFVRVPHRAGTLLLVWFSRDTRSMIPSWQTLFSGGGLKILSDSFRTLEE